MKRSAVLTFSVYQENTSKSTLIPSNERAWSLEATKSYSNRRTDRMVVTLLFDRLLETYFGRARSTAMYYYQGQSVP